MEKGDWSSQARLPRTSSDAVDEVAKECMSLPALVTVCGG